jgi:hypothetical protein
VASVASLRSARTARPGRLAIHAHEAAVLEDREPENLDAQHPEDPVLEPRVERWMATVADGHGLREQKLFGLVVLHGVGHEEPDADVDQRLAGC